MNVVTLTVRHPCPLARPIRADRSVRASHLCHRGRAANLELHGSDPDELAGVIREYEAEGGRLAFLQEDRMTAMVRFPTCACCRTGRVIPVAEQDGALHLAPSTYGPEGETYQFLVAGGEFTTATLDRLPGKVTTVRLATRPISSLPFDETLLVPVGELLGRLTDRQQSAMHEAIEQGYYRIPRDVTTVELAQRFGISRPGFEALLRKAENRLIAALLPYLAVRKAEDPSPPS